MGWNLPPGCTDKDIDDAAPQNEYDDECPYCHAPKPGPCECNCWAPEQYKAQQMREEDEAAFRRLKEYIEFHRRNLDPIDSLKEALERYRECGE